MLDLFGDFSENDPTAALSKAVERCPYQWVPETRGLYAFRAEDVKRILTDKDFWSMRSLDLRAAALPEADREKRAQLKSFFNQWPVFSDGDYHKRVRSVAVRLLRHVVTPELIGRCGRIADRGITEAGSDLFDWVENIAQPLAREAIVALVGEADTDYLVDLGSVILNELATPCIEIDRVDAALEAISEMRGWLCTALVDPPAEFIAGLAELWDDAEFGPDSATALLTQVVTGAYDPTVTMLCAVGELVDEGAFRGATRQTIREEVARLSTPFRFASRYARRPVTVGPHRLGTGERIVLCLGTANLDPDLYPSPQEIRKRSNRPRSFSFGAGGHYCPGVTLAQAIVDVLLVTLAENGVHFSVERSDREPELSMLRYRRLEGRLVWSTNSGQS